MITWVAQALLNTCRVLLFFDSVGVRCYRITLARQFIGCTITDILEAVQGMMF